MRSDFNLDLWLRGPSTLLRLRLRLAQISPAGSRPAKRLKLFDADAQRLQKLQVRSVDLELRVRFIAARAGSDRLRRCLFVVSLGIALAEADGRLEHQEHVVSVRLDPGD